MGRVIALAVWFGLAVGLLEVAVLAVRKTVFHGFLWVGIDAAWLIPVGDVLYFVLLGLGLSLAARLLPRVVTLRVCSGVFTFAACFAILFMFSPSLHKYAAMALAGGMAVQLSRRMARRNESFDPLRRRTVKGMFVAVAALALGIQARRSLGERRAIARLPRSEPSPNVLLVVLDTVRSLNVGFHGYPRPTTPVLDRWSLEGVRFRRALSAAPWTLPSHASMFTGRFPHQLSADWRAPLDKTYPTLAEFYRNQGYLTAGFVGNMGYCGPEFGLPRGFTHYEDFPVSAGQMVADGSLGKYVSHNGALRRLVGYRDIVGRKKADPLTTDFLRWLPDDSTRPFFAFLNYFDAHAPYVPPPPFDTRFGSGAFRAAVPYARREDVSDEHVRILVDNYDASIAYVDQNLGRLFDALRAAGLRERTVVVVVADHGEEFGEHGIFDHGSSLYRPALQVPLVLSFPGRVPAAEEVDAPVSLRDLASTLTRLTHPGVVAPFPGRPLTRFWDPASGGPGADEPLLSSVRHARNVPSWLPVSRGDMHALVVDGMRYIRTGDGGEELYDFEADPAETRDLSASPEGRRVLPRMRDALAAMLS